MADLTRDDLRAAVAAGHLNEAQASSVLALADARAGHRAAEDEPFELFRGFSEIFVTVGLAILIAGAFGLSLLFGHLIPSAGGPVGATLAFNYAVWVVALWAMAEYFTRRRRMVLPSILLVLTFFWALLPLTVWLLGHVFSLESNPRSVILSVIVLVVAALTGWYRRFRLPFTMVLIALCGFAACFTIFGTPQDVFPSPMRGFDTALDLRNSSLAIGTLIFGIVTFAGGMWFDMRDPHRLGRASASGFWLHLCAAPALVNTIAMTFIQMGPGLGYALLALALALITLMALVIDRRSFLTAAIGYLIFLVSYLTDHSGPDLNWFEISAPVLFFIGIMLTVLGAFWTALRLHVMRILPGFPGKSRLPPYATE